MKTDGLILQTDAEIDITQYLLQPTTLIPHPVCNNRMDPSHDRSGIHEIGDKLRALSHGAAHNRSAHSGKPPLVPHGELQEPQKVHSRTWNINLEYSIVPEEANPEYDINPFCFVPNENP